MDRLIEELFVLSIRSFVQSMGLMAEWFSVLQRVGESSLHSFLERQSRELVASTVRGGNHRVAPVVPIPKPIFKERPHHRKPSRELPTRPCDHRSKTWKSDQYFQRGSRLLSGTKTVEQKKMYLDQDLSGDQVKVVQYCIVNVVPGIADNNRIIAGPCLVAFSDDMTPEDFTAWIVAEKCDDIGIEKAIPDPSGPPCFPDSSVERCYDKKYLRVAYSVMGRFNKAEINWHELQAISVAKIADGLVDHSNKIDQLIQNTNPPVSVKIEE